jgi:hypothetical protein
LIYNPIKLFSGWNASKHRKNVYELFNINKTHLLAEYHTDDKLGIIYFLLSPGAAGSYKNFEFDHFKLIVKNNAIINNYEFIDEKLKILL